MADNTDNESLMRADRAFADSVRLLREERGMSQEELADKMAAAGFKVSQITISRIEQKKRPVRLSEAQQLAAIFGRPIAEMLQTDKSQLWAAASLLAEARSLILDGRAQAVKLTKVQQAMWDEYYAIEQRMESEPPTDPELAKYTREVMGALATLAEVEIYTREVAQAGMSEDPDAQMIAVVNLGADDGPLVTMRRKADFDG